MNIFFWHRHLGYYFCSPKCCTSLLNWGLIQRRVQEYSDFWEKNVDLLIKYDLLSLFQISIMLIVIIGLIRLKPWGRLLAMVLNSSTAFLLIGIPLIAYYIAVKQFNAPPPNDLNYFAYDIILWLILGIILIFLTIAYNSKSIKELFQK
mgnify:CR=1 FL=1